FVLLTSQRELFPKLFSCGDNKGLFKAIRLLSSSSSSNSNSESRNNSSASNENRENQLTKTLHSRNVMEDFVLNENTSYGAICDEKINYLGYFNAHEIVMLNILEQKVNETKEQLESMIQMAETDCRR